MFLTWTRFGCILNGASESNGKTQEHTMMDSATRLQLIARISYYIGWLCALCGALVHFGLGTAALRSINITQRNLFEASLMFFVISAASVLRANAARLSHTE